jgi:hypothetical protein
MDKDLDEDPDEPQEPRRRVVHLGSGVRGMPGLYVPGVDIGVPDPEESDWVPPPAPPGLLRRIIGRIRRPHGLGDTANR